MTSFLGGSCPLVAQLTLITQGDESKFWSIKKPTEGLAGNKQHRKHSRVGLLCVFFYPCFSGRANSTDPLPTVLQTLKHRFWNLPNPTLQRRQSSSLSQVTNCGTKSFSNLLNATQLRMVSVRFKHSDSKLLFLSSALRGRKPLSKMLLQGLSSKTSHSSTKYPHQVLAELFLIALVLKFHFQIPTYIL